jgi:hypothetical protein
MWASTRRHVADHSSDVRVAMPSQPPFDQERLIGGLQQVSPNLGAEATLDPGVLPANRENKGEPTGGLEKLTCSLRVSLSMF